MTLSSHHVRAKSINIFVMKLLSHFFPPSTCGDVLHLKKIHFMFEKKVRCSDVVASETGRRSFIDQVCLRSPLLSSVFNERVCRSKQEQIYTQMPHYRKANGMLWYLYPDFLEAFWTYFQIDKIFRWTVIYSQNKIQRPVALWKCCMPVYY